MLRCLVPLLLILGASSAHAQDPTVTDGDRYRTLFENEKVRVLEYKDLPGDKTRQHDHPAFVLYALVPFERTLHLPDGRKLNRAFKAGDVLYSEAQTHVGENVGSTPTHVILIELKPGSR